MALQNNLFAQMLILAVCLASALASTSTRDPKELRTFRLSDSPFYRVPSVQFLNGVIQRQINSPIDPMIGQQGLGMFFMARYLAHLADDRSDLFGGRSHRSVDHNRDRCNPSVDRSHRSVYPICDRSH